MSASIVFMASGELSLKRYNSSPHEHSLQEPKIVAQLRTEFRRFVPPPFLSKHSEGCRRTNQSPSRRSKMKAFGAAKPVAGTCPNRHDSSPSRKRVALAFFGAGVRFCFAHRCFIAAEILARAAALIVRRFRPVACTAWLLFGGRSSFMRDRWHAHINHALYKQGVTTGMYAGWGGLFRYAITREGSTSHLPVRLVFGITRLRRRYGRST